MASVINGNYQPTLGIEPFTIVARCRNAQGAALNRGDLVRLDFTQTAVESGQGTAALTAASNSKFANVTLGPTGPGTINSGVYGVVQEAIVTAGTGLVMFAGVTTATVVSGNYTAGERIGLGTTAVTAGQMTRATTTMPLAAVLIGGTGVTTATVLLPGEVAYCNSAT